MNSNYEMIEKVVEFIEDNMSEDLSGEAISESVNYSMYHVNRMFHVVTDMTLYSYILRRRMTMAAKSLIFTDKPIIEIALDSGYNSQQSFGYAFKKLFMVSPNRFRNQREFAPIQTMLEVFKPAGQVKGDIIVDIRVEELGKIDFIAYKCNTRLGFWGIALTWKKLIRTMRRIPNRKSVDYVIGINDYSNYELVSNEQPSFDYYAGVEVISIDECPRKMSHIQIDKSKYVVFKYRGKSEDSMENVFNFIYNKWFPESTYVLNDNVRMDFVRYGTSKDNEEMSDIEVFVPVL